MGKYRGFVENKKKYCDSGYIYSVADVFPIPEETGLPLSRTSQKQNYRGTD